MIQSNRSKVITAFFMLLSMTFTGFSAGVRANTVVKMDIQQGNVSNDTVYIKLFNEHTPVTVTNFIKYIDDGDFNNLLFTRLTPNFAIQAGFFTYDKKATDNRFIACDNCIPVNSINDYNYPAGLQPVPLDPNITNEGEIGLSNLRGTLAMALAGTDRNSANSQWFVNLADNNDPLDFASGSGGPYAVFGELINNGITVFDAMASHPVYDRSQDIHLLLGKLPLVGYVTDPITDINLVKITAIEKLFSISVVYNNVGSGVIGATKAAEDVDFGILRVGTTYSADITLSNISSAALIINAVANTNNIGVPYSITANTCTTISTIAVASSCLITIEITPGVDGVFDDVINIDFTTPTLNYELTIHAEATSIPAAGNIKIDPVESFDFGDVILYEPSQGSGLNEFIKIKNVGNLNLNILDITLTGADAGEFRFDENCTANNPRERNDRGCVMQVFFQPLTVGKKTAIATITSDDPDEPVLQVVISGGGSLDNDGVPTAVEDSGPNNGDGNNDNIPDSTQNNVVTVQMTDGTYATYLFDETQRFFYFDLVAPADLVNTPDNVVLNDVYKFRLDDIPLSFFGERAEIGIFLPAGITPQAYYMYGSTPDDPNPHWYDFTFDGFTGAQLFSNVAIIAPDGTRINRSFIRLSFVDGQRGDGDLFANGRIVGQGAYVAVPASSSSGKLSLYELLLLLFVIGFLRINYRQA